LFAGDCDGSISAARDDHYVGRELRPEIRWSTIMEDLRRRDFSLQCHRHLAQPGLARVLLDPRTDCPTSSAPKCEPSRFIASPISRPVIARAAVRSAHGLQEMEPRTQEWVRFAIERELHHTIAPEDAGAELQAAAREEPGPAVV